jgi:DNA-directed RNA polymerase subunit RPC12/RpoP
MTQTKNCGPVGSGRKQRPVQKRRKAVLNCSRCDHASPPDGDWIFRITSDGTEIRCPDCHELLTVR